MCSESKISLHRAKQPNDLYSKLYWTDWKYLNFSLPFASYIRRLARYDTTPYDIFTCTITLTRVVSFTYRTETCRKNEKELLFCRIASLQVTLSDFKGHFNYMNPFKIACVTKCSRHKLHTEDSYSAEDC